MTPNHFFEAVTEKKFKLIGTEKKFRIETRRRRTFKNVSSGFGFGVGLGPKSSEGAEAGSEFGSVFFSGPVFLLQRVELLQLVAGWQQVHFNTNPMTFLLELERAQTF